MVLQEIFGVNQHIREVADGYARRGYLAIAPALFDRARRGAALGYDADAIATGRDLRSRVGWDGPCAICKPASTPPAKPAQSRCAVGYYGGQTAPFAHEQVRVPVLLHFGELDLRLPLSDIDKIRRHNPSIEVHMFPADHGFNCDHRKEWHAESAARALDLTLVFMRRHQRRLIPPRKQAVK